MVICLVSACENAESRQSFSEARRTFETRITVSEESGYTPDTPPTELFDLVTYPSEPGSLYAYITADPGDMKKHPAIIWVCGGWDSSIDSFFWEAAEENNDQTGAELRTNGNILMIPSFRGANDNPGTRETLYGEVDDLSAAADFLRKLPYVDENRIYLAGHSTGGTLALLTAAASEPFRAVFSMGPIDNIVNYGVEDFTFDASIKAETDMRSPILWLEDITSRTFVIEGSAGNNSALRQLQRQSKNKNISFFEIDGADHFDYLHSICGLIAQEISQSENGDIEVTQQEIDTVYARG
jgi:dipeptidyl aminopeptidase/acylaminoacyl peptidase